MKRLLRRTLQRSEILFSIVLFHRPSSAGLLSCFLVIVMLSNEASVHSAAGKNTISFASCNDRFMAVHKSLTIADKLLLEKWLWK
jgi:hypothetical protein